MTAGGSLKLLLVTDDHAQGVPAGLAERMTIVAGRLDNTSPDALAKSEAILIDMDLRDLSKVQDLRRRLAVVPRGTPLIFAVDRGSAAHFSVVQANALGGRRMLTRPYDANDVLAALTDGEPRTVVPAAVPKRPPNPSVTVAAALLKGSFRSLTLGRPLDLDTTADAGQQMLLGVQESGLVIGSTMCAHITTARSSTACSSPARRPHGGSKPGFPSPSS